MFLPWEQPQQTVAQSPPQTRQQLFEEQVLQAFDFNLTAINLMAITIMQSYKIINKTTSFFSGELILVEN